MNSNRRLSGVFVETPLLVNNALRGFVETNNGLVLLEGYRVLLRRDYRLLKQVRILSGGWSGLEPMFNGFVGPGMLTGVVVGDHYSTPPFPSILAAIRELAIGNPFGVLIILISHVCIRVNFILAVERALKENIPVKILFVADDSSGNFDKDGRKGLAGISFVLKIAGAMADENRTMEEIYNTCSDICSGNIATVSVNVIKNRDKEIGREKSVENVDSLGGDSALDTSMDGEPRAIEIRQDLTAVTENNSIVHEVGSASELARTVLGYTIDGSLSPFAVLYQHSLPIAILINNYGRIANLELNALVHELYSQLRHRKIKVERVYAGTFLSSRNVGGFSMTAMKVSKNLLKYLDHSVQVPGWPVNVHWSSQGSTSLPNYVSPQSYVEEEPKMLGPILNFKYTNKLRRALEFVCMTLVSCEEQVNKMDTEHTKFAAFFGSQMKSAAEAITEALYNNILIVNCPHALFSQLSAICSNHLHHASGTVYAVLFDGISQWFLRYLHETEIEASMWSEALENGIKAIEYYFDIKRGNRNVLDSLYPMLEVMKKSPDAYEKIAEAAELGSFRSLDPDYNAHAMPDPATHVVALWARAAAEGLKSFTNDISPMDNISDQSGQSIDSLFE